jgi:leucyl aminopeptidase (aminopeptidase T)
MVLPKGRGNGILAVDGFLLYEPAYDHEIPTSPVYLTIEKGKIVIIEGHPLYAGRLRHWLASQKDNSGYYGPIHITLGLNPRAMLTQHLEFECIRGTITFGFGDSSGVARLTGYDFEPVYSDIHWDVSIMRPTMKLDDKLIVENGIVPDELPSL